MTDIYYGYVQSPLGPLRLVGDGERLTGLHMQAQKHAPPLPARARRDDAVFASVRAQLRAYFAGELRSFDVPLAPAGTAFQQRVWRALLEIPFGAVESYGALARRIGQPSAVRAVGAANSRNPIGIVVPCHRVVGQHGALTGYAGGLERKRWLLQHEQRMTPTPIEMSAADAPIAAPLEARRPRDVCR